MKVQASEGSLLPILGDAREQAEGLAQLATPEPATRRGRKTRWPRPGRSRPSRSSRPLPPLHRQRDFILLWAGQGISELGSQVTVVALPLTAILFLHADAAEVGLLQTMLWTPWLIFALVIGAYVDQRMRRPLLVVADIGRSLVLWTIVSLAWIGALSMPVLVCLVFALGSLTVVFEVTYLAYMPSLVRHEQLLAANGRLQATASVAQVGGPGLGGALVQLLSAPTALVADAVSYAASVAGLLLIRASEPPVRHSTSARHVLFRVRQGLRITYRNPILRALVGVAGSYNLFDQWILTLFLLYAIRDLHFTASGVGLVLASGAVGAVAGSVAAAPSVRRLGLGRVLLGSITLECLALSSVPLIVGSLSFTTTVLSLVFGLNGVGVALSSVAAVSIRQAVTPVEWLGRMTASYRFVSYGTVAIGAALSGLIGELAGLRAGLAIGALGLLSTIGWVVFSPLPRLRTLHDAAAYASSAPETLPRGRT